MALCKCYTAAEKATFTKRHQTYVRSRMCKKSRKLNLRACIVTLLFLHYLQNALTCSLNTTGWMMISKFKAKAQKMKNQSSAQQRAALTTKHLSIK